VKVIASSSAYRVGTRLLGIAILILLIGLVLAMPANRTAAKGAQATTTTSGVPQQLTQVEKDVASLKGQVNELGNRTASKDKDFWDKLSAMSALISGLLVAAIGALATYLYNKRQNAIEETKSERELSVLRVQTVQTFMPHLQSADEREKEAALLAIHALGNSELASKLATMYRGEGAVGALSRIAAGSDRQAAKSAEQSLRVIFDTLRASTVQVLGEDAGPRGSGFVVDPAGLILTASHVSVRQEPHTNGNLLIEFWGEERYAATRVLLDEQLGLALLKVDRQGLSPLPIEPKTRDLDLLAEVIVLGYRRNVGWQTSVGRITGISKLKDGELTTSTLVAELQGDLGYGGAPVVNRGGSVVGVFYAIYQPRSGEPTVSYLLPASAIHELLEKYAADVSATSNANP
jgi:S1-C subfamily serine protease